MQDFQTQEQEASLGETASREEAAGSQWEGEETEVAAGGVVRWVVACPLAVGWVACCAQKVDVQMGVLVEVPSSSQKEVVVA